MKSFFHMPHIAFSHRVRNQHCKRLHMPKVARNIPKKSKVVSHFGGQKLFQKVLDKVFTASKNNGVLKLPLRLFQGIEKTRFQAFQKH